MNLALLELGAFPSFWPPIGHTYAREMLCPSSLLQTFPKTQGFCIKRSFLEKNSLFSIKTTFAFIKKLKSRLLRFRKKNDFWKNRDPCPGGQGVGLQGLRSSSGWPTGSQGIKEQAYRVPGSQGIGPPYRVQRGQGVGRQGPRGARGWPTGFQIVKGLAYRVPRGQGVVLQGPRGSPGRSVLKNHFFIESGLKMIQFKTKSRRFIQQNIHSIESIELFINKK